jgi:hypothetical protein
MNLKKFISSIILTCVVAISALAFSCTMPMVASASHCHGGSMAMVSDGTVSGGDCVGSHYATYLQTSLAVFEKQVFGFFVVLVTVLFVVAFWLLWINTASRFRTLGSILYQRYKRYIDFSLPLHRMQELSWLVAIERDLVASVA